MYFEHRQFHSFIVAFGRSKANNKYIHIGKEWIGEKFLSSYMTYILQSHTLTLLPCACMIVDSTYFKEFVMGRKQRADSEKKSLSSYSLQSNTLTLLWAVHDSGLNIFHKFAV